MLKIISIHVTPPSDKFLFSINIIILILHCPIAEGRDNSFF